MAHLEVEGSFKPDMPTHSMKARCDEAHAWALAQCEVGSSNINVGTDNQYSHTQSQSQLDLPNGTNETEFEATQEILSQPRNGNGAYTYEALQLPSTPPEEHWATLIPDTANKECPRIELRGTQEKVRHVIGRRLKYPNKRRELVDTDTVINHKVVSGLQCMIWREWDPDAPGDPSLAVVYLEDFSTNGTYVNTVKVKNEKIAIGDGDDISLGQAVEGRELTSEFRFRFQLEYAKSERSSRRNPNEAGGLLMKYDIRAQIGKGSFAKVDRAINKKTGQWCAVKVIDKKRFKHNPKTMAMLAREVTIMQTLDNPYIVKYYEGFEDEDTLWLVIEYVAGGDLLDFVINKGGLEEHEAADVALQVCEAMSYMHQAGVAHRDLKPENILLTNGPRPRCKIADFGLAKLPGNDTFLKTMCGTPTYLAPEVMLQAPQRTGYSFQVDAWSVGVIIYSCIANASPFQEDETVPLIIRMQNRVPDLKFLADIGCSREAIDFVSRLMVHDPAVRMTVYDALNHPWLAPLRAQRALTKEASSLTRFVDPPPPSASESRRPAMPTGRYLPVPGANEAPTPAPIVNPGTFVLNNAQYPVAPDSAKAPASNWSSMGTLSRSHTLTDEENDNDDDDDDAVSEAPSYSQRLGRMRIESEIEVNPSVVIVEDSQGSNDASQASLLDGDQFSSDLTPPTRAGYPIESTVFSQGIKRKLPTSAFSSDESMQSLGKNGSTRSSLLAIADATTDTNGQAVPDAASTDMTRIADTISAPINGVKTVDYAMRYRAASPASSDSSLSPVEDDAPESTPDSRPLRTKSVNGSGRGSGSRSGSGGKSTPASGPSRRSTRLSTAPIAPTYVESDGEDGRASARRKSGRARKQRRLSAQPSA